MKERVAIDANGRRYVTHEPLLHEREKVAQWMIERGYATGHGDTTEDLLRELEWQVKEREREVCAKVCDERASKAPMGSDEQCEAEDCAYAIRARGESK